MLLPLIVIELVVCLTLMLSGWLLDGAHGVVRLPPGVRRLGPYGGVTVRASPGQDRGRDAKGGRAGEGRRGGGSGRPGGVKGTFLVGRVPRALGRDRSGRDRGPQGGAVLRRPLRDAFVSGHITAMIPPGVTDCEVPMPCVPCLPFGPRRPW